MGRLTRQDWLAEGLRTVAAEGPDGLTIDALCRALGVTKGSFYHHFSDHRTYVDELLAFFEREGTLEIIEAVECRGGSAAQKLQRLLEIVVAFSRRPEEDPERAVRAWALQDERVREVQERIDARRIGYVTELLVEMVGDRERAERMARLLYAALVGSEQMQPPLRGDDLRALFDEYLRLYRIEGSE